jgi:16S rRNA (adenine1518-N6/adenine1519-N6)-dimethyltransferase
LIGWLHKIANGANIKSLTLMFQKEVAQRIVANVGDAQYGRLSVLSNIIADTKILFDVPNTAFVPRPKVQSAVVQIIPNKNKIKKIKDIAVLEKLTAKLFGQRRKMIRGIIKTDWEKFGLNGTERAEEISPEMFLKIASNIDVNLL